MANVTESELKKQLKNKEFAKIYYIFGTEKYLIKYNTDYILKRIVGENPSEFNFHTLKSVLEIDDVAAACDILPFMSEYNCVHLYDFDADILNSAEMKKLEELIENIADGTIVVISQPTIENKKGNNHKKLLSLCNKYGVVLSLDKKSNSDISKMLISRCSRNGVTLSYSQANKIVELCGADLNMLSNEIEKLCAYVGTGEVKNSDIEKLITQNTEYKIYRLSDNIFKGNIDEVFKQLDYLFYQKEKPEFILSILSSAYIDVYRVKVAIESGFNSSQIVKDFDYKRREFVIGAAERNGRNLSIVSIRKMLDRIFEADRKMKSTSANNRTILETLVTELILYSKM